MSDLKWYIVQRLEGLMVAGQVEVVYIDAISLFRIHIPANSTWSLPHTLDVPTTSVVGMSEVTEQAGRAMASWLDIEPLAEFRKSSWEQYLNDTHSNSDSLADLGLEYVSGTYPLSHHWLGELTEPEVKEVMRWYHYPENHWESEGDSVHTVDSMRHLHRAGILECMVPFARPREYRLSMMVRTLIKS